MTKWLVLLSVLLYGCSSDPTPAITKYKLVVNADASINQYQNNVSNPVVVKLYQLKDQQVFKQLAFIDLYSNDVQLLGSSLVSKQVLPVVLPKSKKDIELDVSKDTRYIATLVEFANYQDGQPKAVTLVPTQTKQYLELDIKDNKSTLKVVTPKSSWWQIF
ncbi:type VI secretion system lipoprotein TssJ [Vibrio sp. S4M6]|uniref:type VI secretion system lipoprotein TssJ n=1 Tax=Vibrio sinus TaxID=2946865 RepID=UPI002029FBA2|nr:type VI secretion system lipoprotein TssJ [Vibrio sinus]MCL9783161.1 type VI secretion system lipoprotein TssJ [Vibrio sinus]